jgi:hypothetical protein
MFNRFFFRGLTICILIGGTSTFSFAQYDSTPWPSTYQQPHASYQQPHASTYTSASGWGAAAHSAPMTRFDSSPRRLPPTGPFGSPSYQASNTPLPPSQPAHTPIPPYGESGLAAIGPMTSVERTEPIEPLPAVKDSDCKGDCATSCSACPHFYAYGELLFLRRGNSSITRDIVQSQPLLVNGPSTQTFFSTSDLDFQFEPAFRALVGHRLHDGWAWEASYLGLFDATAYEACIFPTDPNTILSFPDPPSGLNFNVFADIDRMRIRYSSSIHSGELNLVHCLGGCAHPCKGDCDPKDVHVGNTWCRTYEWLFGLRYLSVKEQLEIYGERDLEITGGDVGPIFGTEDGFYNISTRNNLFGPQIGARMRHWNDRLGWELSGKLGAFYNEAAQRQLVVDFPDFELRAPTGASGSQFAYLSEVNLTGLFRLTHVWNLRAGYNLIYIGGLALAPDQLDFSSGAASGQGLNRSGGILLHGVNLGLEARW